MKYIAVLDTDEIEDFAFFEDGKEKYLHGIDANSVNGEWIYLPFKPLEQEPTTKNDLGVDCVSRQAVIEITAETGALETQDRVKALPSVTPIRPKGHWIEVTNGRGGHECDVCHDYAPSFQNGNEYLSAFCPNCGAKMESEEK